MNENKEEEAIGKKKRNPKMSHKAKPTKQRPKKMYRKTKNKNPNQHTNAAILIKGTYSYRFFAETIGFFEYLRCFGIFFKLIFVIEG